MSKPPNAQLRDDTRSLQAYAERRAAILAGDTFPEVDDLRSGLPFFRGDMRLDIRTCLQSELLSDGLEQSVRDACQLAFDNPTRDTLRHAAARFDHPSSLQRRLDIYAAYLGDATGRDRTIRRAFERVTEPLAGSVFAVTLGLGLSQYPARSTKVDGITTERVDDILDLGARLYQYVAEMHGRLTAAKAHADGDEDLDEAPAAESQAVEIADGIPEEYLGGPKAEPEPEPPGVVAVPALDSASATSHNRDIRKSWKGIAGERLPIAQVGDVAGMASRLTAQWPWAESVIHSMLEDLSLGGDAVFHATCLIGEPGCGKSALLKAMATEAGLPVQTYDLGGSADSSMMGTSSRWSTAEESVVLQFVKQTKQASVAIIWDELEKAGQSRHNGNALDAMLPFLVRHQAQNIRDPALNVEVNLSFVSHFATANTIAEVPAPLKDRMRIIRMPSPGPQHIGLLTERILDDLSKRRKRDRGWLPPLAQDEIDNILDAWRGGSIRRLERYVGITVAKRDQHLIGRA